VKVEKTSLVAMLLEAGEENAAVLVALHLPLTPAVGGMRPHRDGIHAF